jgi:probable F420-dependent oxidoreductase
MKFWQSLALTEVDHLVEVARIAEEVGFTGVTVADHLVTPARVDSTYPYTSDGSLFWDPADPFPDPWLAIAAMAAETTRLRFMPYVYVLPLRDPFSVAKSLSSAAVLSGDRLALGFGVGWMEEEFELTGQPFAARGARADEMIEVMQKLMTGELVRHEGRFYRFDEVRMAPAPDRRVEIRVGGHSRRALRRAARYDGWIAVALPPDEMEELVTYAQKERQRIGRVHERFDVMVTHFPSGPGREEYDRYRDAGVSEIHVPPWRYRGITNASLDEKRRSLEEFAERYIVPLSARG